MQRIRLYQHPFQLHMLQQGTEGRDLSAFVGGVSALGDGDAKSVGIDAHLSDVDEIGRRA